MDRRVRSRSTGTAFCLAVLVVAGQASAAIVLYEPFDYPVGTLNGQAGGTGFSGAWIASGTTAAVIASPGLTYGDLATQGNRLDGLTSMSMRRPFSSTGLTGNGSTLWFSFLIAATDTTVGTATAIPSFFSNSTGPHGQASGFAVSYNINSATDLYMDARIGGTTVASLSIPGTNYYTSGPALVLGRITFSDTANQDRLEVWRNPTLGAVPGAPLLAGSGQWVDPGANNSFYMNKYDPPDRMIDEIRLGTTLADVLPIPEPAGWVAIGLAAVAGVGWRRLGPRRSRRGRRAKLPPAAR